MVVEQASPNFAHQYTQPGAYRATLTVTDSRGLESLNVADAFIEVGQVGGLVNYALSTNGALAIPSTSHLSGSYPAAAAINGDRNGANWGTATGGWNDGTRALYPDTLEVNFDGPAKAITEIRVYTLQNNWKNNPGEPNENTSCSGEGILDFDVQTWNGTAWVTVPGGSVTGNDRAMRIFTFPAITTTKFRVLVNNSRNNFSRIVELEAYGLAGQ
jgi:PKD repeat protein